MQHHTHNIQLSNHVKNKIKYHHASSLSRSSDELNISDHTSDDNETRTTSSSSEHLYRKRCSTFTTRKIQKPLMSDHTFMGKRSTFQPINTPQRQGSCQECIHRQNLIHNGNQHLLRAYNENRRLTEELRSAISLNHKYEEENEKLKQHIKKMNAHLEEYKNNFNQLKQKYMLEKNNQSQKDVDANHLRRLRHELNIYRQVVASKQQEDQKNIDYIPYQDRN